MNASQVLAELKDKRFTQCQQGGKPVYLYKVDPEALDQFEKSALILVALCELAADLLETADMTSQQIAPPLRVAAEDFEENFTKVL